MQRTSPNKEADTKTPTMNLQTAKRQQHQQTTFFGGLCFGSVRAAWHCFVLSHYFNWLRRWVNGAKLFLPTLHERLYHLQLGQRQIPFGTHFGCMGLLPSYFLPHLSQAGNWQCLQRSARCVASRLAQSFLHLCFRQELQNGPQCQALRFEGLRV